jgi:hypothetical protein
MTKENGTKILKIIKGNIEVYTSQMSKIRIAYSGGDAKSAVWYDYNNESIKAQLHNGKIIIINKNGILKNVL